MNINARASLSHLMFFFVTGLFLTSCGQQQEPPTPGQTEHAFVELSDADVDNIVRRTYQFVAMYNVNNKGAFDPTNPMSTGALNVMKANTNLMDHTLQIIARPNNDTLYTTRTCSRLPG